MKEEEAVIKLNKRTIESLFKRIRNKDKKSIGLFTYNDLIIRVKKPRAENLRERSRRLYHKRRESGLCVQCGKKVRKMNKKSGKPYRSCKFHRELESQQKKKIREMKK